MMVIQVDFVLIRSNQIFLFFRFTNGLQPVTHPLVTNVLLIVDIQHRHSYLLEGVFDLHNCC